MTIGEWHPRAVKLRQNGYAVVDIAENFGVTTSAVYRAVARSKPAEVKIINRETEKRVLEAYFSFACLNVSGLARRLEMEPAEVAAIIAKNGLPDAKGLDR